MKWNELSMAKAIEAVNNGEMGYSTAAIAFDVPKTTLRRRSNGYKVNNDIDFASSKELPWNFASVFSPEQEIELVTYLKEIEARLFGLSSFETRVLVYQLAEKNNIKHPFVNGIAGKDWFQGFLNCNPSLSLRKPESTSAARAAGFNRVAVHNFFELLLKIIGKYQLKPHRIFNVDETGCSCVPKTHSKVLAEKGKKQVGILTSAERGKNVTVELCVSASGELLPPLFIFPRKRIKPDLLNNTLAGSWEACHPSGWIQHEIFFDWLKWFINHVKPTAEDPVLLILDGHTTHTNNLDMINYASDHHVIMLCLPPHCTHRLQPLDVSFMKPVSSCYEKEVKSWLSSNPGRIVTPDIIPSLFSDALRAAAKPETIINGFRKSGMYSTNPNVFQEKDFAPAEVTKNNKAAKSNDAEIVLDREDSEDECLQKLSQSLSGLLKEADTQESIPLASTSTPSTSTSTPSLKRQVHFFRPRIIDNANSDEDLDAPYSEINVCYGPTATVINQASIPRLVDYSSTSDEEEFSDVKNRKKAIKFTVTPYEIKPLPSISENSPPKKRRRGKTVILTSPEYCQELQEKQTKNNKQKKTPATSKNKAKPKTQKKLEEKN